MRITLLFLLPLAVYAQSDAGIAQGRAAFRGNCAFCHGLNAQGGRGPNLVSAPLHHGDTDSDLKNSIKNGIPGTPMPAFSGFGDDELNHLVKFLRSLSGAAAPKTTLSGDAKAGRDVYEKNGCAGCHRIGLSGSVFGPDLTRIGAARPVEYLRESIVKPSADIAPEWEGVTVVDNAGKRTTGVRINEDTFTLQLRTMAQKFASFSKQELRTLSYEKKSLMPAYEKLAPADLDNLLAYLATLAGGAGNTVVKEVETRR